MSCQTEDGKTEPVLDGEEGQHEAHTEHRHESVQQDNDGHLITRVLHLDVEV